MKKSLFCGLICCAALTWTSLVFSQDWSAEQNKIWEKQKTIWELWKKGDLDARLNLYHNHCVLWSARLTFPSDKPLLKRSYNKIESYELQPFEIRIIDNVAIVQYLCKWTSGGAKHFDRVTDIWIRQNGNWKIVGYMSASCSNPVRCP